MQNKIITLLKEQYPQAPVDWGHVAESRTDKTFMARLKKESQRGDTIFRYLVAEILDTWAESKAEKWTEFDFWSQCFGRINQAVLDMESVLGGLAELEADSDITESPIPMTPARGADIVGQMNKRGKADL